MSFTYGKVCVFTLTVRYLISSLLFFPGTSTNWIVDLLVGSSHFLILFLLFSILAILFDVLQNFLNLSFCCVELLISIHSFN